MKEFKVCFVSHHFQNPSVLLNTILKMTPMRLGKWKEMTAVTDPFQADYVVCLDGMSNVPVPTERCMYFAQHPKGVSAYRPLNDKGKCLGVFPNDKYLNPGEWWITYDYDALEALKPPNKSKNLISISTYHDYPDKPTYQHRIRFLEEYVKISKDIDIYGRQEGRFKANSILKDNYRGVTGIPEHKCNYRAGDHIIGKDTELIYRYALDFDHGRNGDGKPVHNYFSERFYDSMLLWTMPIYFGGDNVQDFLPWNSFVYVDISGDLQSLQKEAKNTLEIVNDSFRERNLSAIAEARDLLLNKYQLWPFVYSAIKNL